MLARWRERDVFHESQRRREGAPRYVFYEGPPTANGRPGSHHVLSRVFKDIFPRYQTMRGKLVERRGGWDTHGLPVELAVEQQLGISSKHEIEAYGIAEFNERCRASVFEFLEDWQALTERIGFWVDLDRAYRTLDPTYIESVWWALKKIADKGLLYEGYKVVPYCPRCGTALSSHEVALGYKDVVDPSLYVRMPVAEDGGPVQRGDELLVWTTTPWTLVANAAIAVDPELTYVRVKTGVLEAPVVLAEALVERVLGEGVQVLDRFPGAALDGVRYEPPFPFLLRPRVGRARAHRAAGGLRLRRRRHGPRAHGDRLRRGRLPARRALRPERRQPGAARRHVRRAHRQVRRPLRQGRRHGPHRGPQAPRPRAARGGARALLPALLALGQPAHLLREADLVHRDLDAARPPRGRQRGGQLAPGAHQARAVRRLAGGQRRLGALARALLGHAAAGLARRGRQRHGHRLLRRARGALGREGHRPAPPLRRRHHVPEPRLGQDRAPRPRGHRRVVRLRGDAVRAVARAVRERRRRSRSSTRPTSSARRSTRRAGGSTRCTRSRCC